MGNLTLDRLTALLDSDWPSSPAEVPTWLERVDPDGERSGPVRVDDLQLVIHQRLPVGAFWFARYRKDDDLLADQRALSDLVTGRLGQPIDVDQRYGIASRWRADGLTVDCYATVADHRHGSPIPATLQIHVDLTEHADAREAAARADHESRAD